MVIQFCYGPGDEAVPESGGMSRDGPEASARRKQGDEMISRLSLSL